MAAKLTVIIPCKDERKNIRPCIEAVRGIADEILVADSGSTDGTLEIVRQTGGCRLIEREYVHSGDFKNWAIPQARCEWVLIVDADERVTPVLADEIRRVLSGASPKDGYWIYRDNYFLGHCIRYSGWGSDCVLRLFRRDLGRYEGDSDHAKLIVSTGREGTLRARMTHYTYWTYEQYFHKFHRYTTQRAEIWAREGRRPSFLRMLTSGPLRFLHAYLIRGGFLDGFAGLQVCFLTGLSSFMKQARLWEMQCGRKQPDPEAAQPATAGDVPPQRDAP